MKQAMLIIGPVFSLGLGLSLWMLGLESAVCWTAGVTVICALWWISEPIPIPATALIPLAIFPLCGVLQPVDVGQSYGDQLVLLMLGGFMLSAAMERSGAHRRIALNMVHLFGGASGRRLVLGFMAASALLSMWISNAATTLMLLPIAMAVVDQTTDRKLQKSLLLGIAYAASVGGVGTPIGTPPNLVFMKIYADATGVEPAFLDWMKWALPVVLTMVPIVGWWLTRGLSHAGSIQLPTVGQWRPDEVRTLMVFGLTALLWVTRKQPYGGWSGWAGLDSANDACVALLAVVAMFLIPNGKGERLLDWEKAVGIPWGILILYGGGITLAKAFVTSGLSQRLGDALSGLGQLPIIVLIGAICLAVTFLTEVTSNTATTTLLMPILAAAALRRWDRAQVDHGTCDH